MDYPVAYRKSAWSKAGLSNATRIRIDQLTFRGTANGVPIEIPLNVPVPANDNNPPGKIIKFPKKKLPPPDGGLKALRKRFGYIGPNPAARLIENVAETFDQAVGQRLNTGRVTPYTTACGFSTTIPWVPFGLKELYGASCQVLRGINGPDPYTVGAFAAEYERGDFVGFGLWEWTRIRTYEVGSADLGPVEWPATMGGYSLPSVAPFPQLDPDTLPVAYPTVRPQRMPLRTPRPVTAWPYGYIRGYGLLPLVPEAVQLVQQIAPRVRKPRVTNAGPPKPPPKNVKERKLRLSFRGSTLGLVLSTVTEGVDIIEAIWWALPAEYRTAYATPQQMLADIWNNFEHINWLTALGNLAWVSLINFVYGSIGNALAHATAGNPYWVGIGGPQTGIHDQPPKIHGVGGPDWIPDLFPLNH